MFLRRFLVGVLQLEPLSSSDLSSESTRQQEYMGSGPAPLICHAPSCRDNCIMTEADAEHELRHSDRPEVLAVGWSRRTSADQPPARRTLFANRSGYP